MKTYTIFLFVGLSATALANKNDVDIETIVRHLNKFETHNQAQLEAWELQETLANYPTEDVLKKQYQFYRLIPYGYGFAGTVQAIFPSIVLAAGVSIVANTYDFIIPPDSLIWGGATHALLWGWLSRIVYKVPHRADILRAKERIVGRLKHLAHQTIPYAKQEIETFVKKDQELVQLYQKAPEKDGHLAKPVKSVGLLLESVVWFSACSFGLHKMLGN